MNPGTVEEESTDAGMVEYPEDTGTVEAPKPGSTGGEEARGTEAFTVAA